MERIELGLKKNWKQFTLLVIINGFVGAMVGLERTVLPQLATDEFAVEAKAAILSFIIVFGVSKALTNYFMGVFADKVGRKRLLVIGWLFALPIPFVLIYANHWYWIIFANVLLGINQGLAWSSTVVMKIDLVGEKQRGLAMGINESAGYLSVGIMAFLTGWIAGEYGVRPYPFYLGIAVSILGLLLSWLLVKDTVNHVVVAAKESSVKLLKNVFWETTWKDNNLGTISQAGLVNNLNDGMVWGLFPVILHIKGFDIDQIALIVAVYPSVWGIGQLITGRLADVFIKKWLLFLGMLLQGFVLIMIGFANEMSTFVVLSALLGLGTAIVYPAFLAAIGDYAHPQQRAKSIGVFRLWRDLGYAVGAALTGIVADFWNVETAIFVVGGLTIFSAIIILVRMDGKIIKN